MVEIYRDELLCEKCEHEESQGVVSGQGFTKSRCIDCDRLMSFPTTHTDALCRFCSVAGGTCIHCGENEVVRL